MGDRLEFCRLCLHFSIASDCCPGVCNNYQILEEKQSFYIFLYSELCSKKFYLKLFGHVSVFFLLVYEVYLLKYLNFIH